MDEDPGKSCNCQKWCKQCRGLGVTILWQMAHCKYRPVLDNHPCTKCKGTGNEPSEAT